MVGGKELIREVIRFNDLPKMVTALDAVRDGRAFVHDVIDDNDKARFDIYGMDLGFFRSNYAPARISGDALKGHRRTKVSVATKFTPCVQLAHRLQRKNACLVVGATAALRNSG
jgi:hypothetical protein